MVTYQIVKPVDGGVIGIRETIADWIRGQLLLISLFTVGKVCFLIVLLRSRLAVGVE